MFVILRLLTELFITEKIIDEKRHKGSHRGN